MKAHDVRNLRVCKTCNKLGPKDLFLRTGDCCLACAWHTAGSLESFLAAHPREEWGRLSIEVIGADNMRALLAKVRIARPEGFSKPITNP